MRGRNLKLLLAACLLVTVIYIVRMYSVPSHPQLDENLLNYVNELSNLIAKSQKAISDLEYKLAQHQKSIKPANSKDNEPRQRQIQPHDIDLPVEIKRGNAEQRKFELEKISHSGGMCLLSEAPTPSVDIQMVSLLESLNFADVDGGVWKQGFNIVPDTNRWTSAKPLRVFVIPHSHDDPGWVKTYDQYYSQQVKKILDNMITKLTQHQEMKFIYAEISFFSTWFEGITETQKQTVRSLLAEGRFELVTGGWVMPDEAAANYYAMIDQLIEGHHWIRDNIGPHYKPLSAWSIDPFGHSSSMAYILRESGLKNMLIQRIHYSVKKHLAQNKQLEFNWRQTWDAEGSSEIFCHMMPFYSYDVPHTCGPDPKICCQFDFLRLPGGKVQCPWGVAPSTINDGNVARRAELLLDQYRKKSMLFKSNVLLIPLGDDFRYDTAAEWDNQYTNYQKLFQYMNSNIQLNVQAQFGTLSDYFNALREEMEEQSSSSDQSKSAVAGFPTLSGDFYTYADRADHYWSGYFTSRPYYKHWDRTLEMTLRSAEILYSLARTKAMAQGDAQLPLYQNLIQARRSLGLFQHHDGITGTAKDFVVQDYGNRMWKGWKSANEVIEMSASILMSRAATSPVVLNLDTVKARQDALVEQTLLEVSKSESRQVVLYNPSPHERVEVISLVTTYPQLSVTDSKGLSATCQLSPVFNQKSEISSDTFELSFEARIPALGLASYLIKATDTNPCAIADVTFYNLLEDISSKGVFQIERRKDSKFNIFNSQIEVEVSTTTGMTLTQTVKKEGGERTSDKLEMNFVRYRADSRRDHSAGAYLFLPLGESEGLGDASPLIRVVTGNLLHRVESFRHNIQHTIQLDNTEGPESMAVHISNIDNISPESNYELAMKMSTDVEEPNRAFYSDLNGFTLHKRRYHDKLTLQGNVYPITSQAYMEHNNKRVTVLTAQSAGVAVVHPGDIEIMLDRRLSQDDNRGLGQGVTDSKDTLSKFSILIEARESNQGKFGEPVGYPTVQANIIYQHLVSPISRLHVSQGELAPDWQGLSDSLPCEIHLLNLRSMDVDESRSVSLLLLHHQAADCGMKSVGLTCQSSSGEVDLSNLFKEFSIKEVSRRSLTDLHDHHTEKTIDINSIKVKPMHISAYRLQMT